MIGAIVGDIIGSVFETSGYKEKDFVLFKSSSQITDDSILTLAVANSLMECNGDWDRLSAEVVEEFRYFGNKYPAGYGLGFNCWLRSKNPTPYNSFGNGAAMRVSPVAYFAKDPEEVKLLSRLVTRVTHNHPEGLKGAEATAVCVYLALHGAGKEEIEERVSQNYYSLAFTTDEIRESYCFDETCQGTVPQAIRAFLDGQNFEDCIRNDISLGGDADTLGAITGGIAGAFYGVPDFMRREALRRLPPELAEVYRRFARLMLENC